MGGEPLILLDTHVLIWLDVGDARLGRRARQAIDQALAEDRLAASAISFWEAARLQHKGRITLPQPLNTWRRDLLNSGLLEIQVSGDIGIFAATLEGLHADPADRILVATAALRGGTLLTADDRILEWPGRLLSRDARR